MIKKIVIIGASLALSGCVAYKLDDVLAEQPEGVYQSSKDVKTYVSCLDKSWLNKGNTIVREQGGNALVLAEFNSHIIAAVKVEPKGTKTVVTHYFPNPLQRKGFTHDVRECL